MLIYALKFKVIYRPVPNGWLDKFFNNDVADSTHMQLVLDFKKQRIHGGDADHNDRVRIDNQANHKAQQANQ